MLFLQIECPQAIGTLSRGPLICFRQGDQPARSDRLVEGMVAGQVLPANAEGRRLTDPATLWPNGTPKWDPIGFDNSQIKASDLSPVPKPNQGFGFAVPTAFPNIPKGSLASPPRLPWFSGQRQMEHGSPSWKPNSQFAKAPLAQSWTRLSQAAPRLFRGESNGSEVLGPRCCAEGIDCVEVLRLRNARQGTFAFIAGVVGASYFAMTMPYPVDPGKINQGPMRGGRGRGAGACPQNAKGPTPD